MVLQQQQESIEKGEPLERQNGPQWRYTRDSGWQNITKWNRAPSVRSNLGIQFVHPGLIGAQILLLTAIAMLWASDEWQIARVMGREPDVDEPEIGAEHSAQESAE